MIINRCFKKIIGSKLSCFMIGLIISSSICITYAYSIFANDVGYSPSNNRWNVDNVNDAIEYIYNRWNPCVSPTDYYNTFAYLGESEIIHAASTATSTTFNLPKGKYILFATARTIEYSTEMSITGSDKLKQIGSIHNTFYDVANDGSNTSHYWSLIYGRGNSELKVYTLDTDVAVTLTFTIRNTTVSSDVYRYVSAGRVFGYQMDY